jgi:hypothetical protein
MPLLWNDYLCNKFLQGLLIISEISIFANGEMPERLNGTVLKTVERDERSVGSNPSLSAFLIYK